MSSGHGGPLLVCREAARRKVGGADTFVCGDAMLLMKQHRVCRLRQLRALCDSSALVSAGCCGSVMVWTFYSSGMAL